VCAPLELRPRELDEDIMKQIGLAVAAGLTLLAISRRRTDPNQPQASPALRTEGPHHFAMIDTSGPSSGPCACTSIVIGPASLKVIASIFTSSSAVGLSRRGSELAFRRCSNLTVTYLTALSAGQNIFITLRFHEL